MSAPDLRPAQPAPPAQPRAPRLGLWVALVALASFAGQAWMLALEWQLDDFALLADPWALFAQGHHTNFGSEEAFALRWVLWAFWGLLVGFAETRPAAPVLAAGLALHAATAGLLALALLRALGPGRGRWAALVAGLGFGLGTGGIQAVSWPAGWGDLTSTFFALLAAERFLAARAGGPGRRSRRRLAGSAALLAALLSKESVLGLAPALWLAVQTAARPRSLGRAGAAGQSTRTAAIEALWCGAALALALVARAWYLGSLAPRYSDVFPGPQDLLLAPLRGLWMLGQALLPHNASALLEAEHGRLFTTWPARLVFEQFGLTPAWVALALVALVGLAAARLGGARLALALLALAAAAAASAAPAGLLVPEVPHNGVGRLLYLPLAPTWAALGLAVAVLGRAILGRAAFAAPPPPLRRSAWPVALAALLLLALGTALSVRGQYLAVERAASAERRAWLEAARIERLALSAADAPARLLAFRAPDNFAGVAQLGPMLPLALEPPFWRAPGPPLEYASTPIELLALLAEPRPTGERARLLLQRGALEADELPRARLHTGLGQRRGQHAASGRPPTLAARLPAVLDLGPVGPPLAPLAPTDAGRVDLPLPVVPYGFAGLVLELSGSGPFELLWLDAEGRTLAHTHSRLAGHAEPTAPARIAVGAPLARAFLLGPPVAALELRGEAARLELLTGLTAPVVFGFAPDADILLLDPDRPPAVELELPAGLAPPPFARIELHVPARPDDVRLFADLLLPADLEPGAHLRLPLVQWHGEGDAAPAALTGPTPTWDLLVGGVILPILAQRERNSGPLTWRAHLLHTDGSRIASSPAIPGRFQTPP